MTKSKIHSPQQSEEDSLVSSLNEKEMDRVAEALMQLSQRLQKETSSPLEN
jgi:hypothetical protein